MSPGRYTRREVTTLLGVEEDFITLLEAETLVTADAEGRYDEPALERIRLCRTLQAELGVNVEGLEVALHLIEVIQDERREFAEVLAWLKERLAEEP